MRVQLLTLATALLRAPRAPLEVEHEPVKGYTMHDEFIVDDFEWLEEDTSPEVQKWAKGQNERTATMLAGSEEKEGIADRLYHLFNSEATSSPRQYGERDFFSRQMEGEDKPTFFFSDTEGKEHVLLDTKSMEGSVSALIPSWDGLKVAYRHNPEYNDEAFLIILDINNTENFIELARLPGAKYAYPSWDSHSTGLFYTFLPELPENMPEGEHPGLQTVVYLALPDGDKVAIANNGTVGLVPAVVVPPTHDPTSFVTAGCTRDGRFLIRTRMLGWDKNRIDVMRLPATDEGAYNWTGHEAEWELLIDEGSASAMHFDERFFIWQMSGNHERGHMVTIADSDIGGDFIELVPQHEDVLDNAELIGGFLVLHYLKDLHPRVDVVSLDGKHVRSLSLPDNAQSTIMASNGPCAIAPVAEGHGLGIISSFSGDPNRTLAYFSVQAPLHPLAIMSIELPDGEPKVWFQKHVDAFNIEQGQVLVEQEFVQSGDARVPMLITRLANATLPQNTILYGYGGFGVTMYPSFKPHLLAWMERGGAYAVTSLRGGNEYGLRWHEQGRGFLKQQVFDDYANSARHLVKSGITTPSQLMAMGGSNGGLLVGVALTQTPELFGAVVCRVPLLDMIKYPLFDSGATWIPEYGDPANATEFHNLLAYSPFHHVVDRSERPYPPTLVVTSWEDDRVSPMHARKFEARLLEANQDAWLRLHEGGHGGVAKRRSYADSEAESLAFGLLNLQNRQRHGSLRAFGETA